VGVDGSRGNLRNAKAGGSQRRGGQSGILEKASAGNASGVMISSTIPALDDEGNTDHRH